MAWFTYDTELPPGVAQANLGDPGHRWLTAIGPILGNQVLMEIDMESCPFGVSPVTTSACVRRLVPTNKPRHIIE